MIEVTSVEDLRAWLGARDARTGGVWLVTWKAGDPRHVPYDAAVEELIAEGWVDGQARGLDAARSMRRIAPRAPGSTWSAANRARVAKLEAEGRMTDRGRALVAEAKASGAWDRTADAEAGVVPPDLARALDAGGVAATFDGFPPSSKRVILEWIGTAKTEATRSKRIGETVSEAKAGRRAHHWRR